MSSTPVETPPPNSLPREGLIDTAVRFLTNANVIERPLHQKQSFLKSKGLTDEEIEIALQRANLQTTAIPQQQQDAVIPMHGLPQHTIIPYQMSVWSRMRDIVHTLALLGGLGYVIYWVYKTYIEPFLFGRPKPKKTTEDSLSSIEEAVKNVNRSTADLKTEIRSELSRLTHERETGTARSLAEIKSDIATVKGLLLSRQQFPSAPNAASLRTGQNSKPSIPAWQMSTEQKNGLKDDQENGTDKDDPCSEKPSDLLPLEPNGIAEEAVIRSSKDTLQGATANGDVNIDK